MAGQRGVRHEAAARAALDVLIVLCSIVATGWLALGALALATRDVPWVAQAVATAAAGGSAWGRALIDAASASEPPSQAVLDYGFSLLNLVLAGVLLVAGRRTWPVRLLVLALVGSAGAFNLQSHIAARAVESATGLAVGGLHQIVLHGIACAAYITALLVFPTPSWDGLPGGKSARRGLVTTAAVTFLLVGVGTALLPHTISCVLFFGFLVPVVGLLVLPRRIRRGPGAELRTQARLLFSTLVGGFAIAVVLAVVTLLLSQLTDAPDLTLVDPTAHAQGTIAGEPIALLFWFARLESAAIPVVVLVATTSDRLWAAERWFSRALAVLLVGVVGGGAFVVLRTIAVGLVGAGGSDVLAAVVVALLLGPLYVRAERFVDRLLYGTRPAPYRVLADITALSHLSATDSTSAQAPDLSRVAQAVGLALGARACRLTVYRPGLRDRTYKWAQTTDRFSARDLLDVPVRHGNGEVGLLAVDRQAVSGLTEQRQHLLADIADALGVVLEASRSGIELERQLRAALAHAEEIAVSRRRIVAEMDGERRRIERDLHDGAQHHLVSLRLTLGLVEHHVTTGDLGQARSWLRKLTEQLDAAESVLAATADGVSSLVLSERGLVAALEVQLAAAHPPVGFDAAGVAPGRRFPAAIESAVWFCCAESVGNARKHAPDAPVSVRLTERVGVLAFVVHDEGPGFAVDAAEAAGGRGLRNMTTRMAAIGGTVSIRSAPGAGTAVEGTVPLPDAPVSDVASAPVESIIPESLPSDAAPHRPSRLTGQVRDVLRTACSVYRHTRGEERVHELISRLDGPVRVAVLGTSEASRQMLVEALTGAPTALARCPVTLIGTPDVDGAAADAFLLLLHYGRAADLGLLDALRAAGLTGVVAVLARADEPGDVADRAVGEYGQDPAVRRVCQAVVSVAPDTAVAAARLREQDHRLLREWATAPRLAPIDPDGGDVPDELAPLVDRLGPSAARRALGLVQRGQGDTRTALAAALVRHSGLDDLQELITSRFVRSGDVLRTRSVLGGLDILLRSTPIPGKDARGLGYELERIRTGAHELRELELLDLLRSGDLPLPDDERREAERLLGGEGSDIRSRLGLNVDATTEQVSVAAAALPARWRQVAAHPVASARVREAAQILVRTAEQLMIEVEDPTVAR
jgi:signal transduction histidine kinase